MRIAELFRRDIYRTIEEVVKVDLSDDQVIANELDEYIATRHILEEFEEVLDAYQESINSPNETCTIWVSGFFGSGKSSWAKVLGYLLENPIIAGRSAVDRFFERTEAPRLRALLATIHATAPTLTVLLSMATGSDAVARDGEHIVLPVYRALLGRLGYSRNPMLAELEYTLEGDGRLQAFEERFTEATRGKRWVERRYTSLAKSEASHALHLLDPGTFPQADSWARAAFEPTIDADGFADRVLALLDRRGGGARRVAFVVDEAGQYVAKKVEQMLALQGLAEAFQKKKGRIWLAVTSQERLNEVIDLLESMQIELPRVQARFPLRVDLLPSDIDEVTGKRVLDKTDAGQQAVRTVVGPRRQQLTANTRLASPTRAADVSEDEIVRLYPLLPYQVQLLIDAVSVRRLQGGRASPMTGGSNRTLIRHVQQLVAHPRFGLGNQEVGALVTLDRSYDLFGELIPTSWQGEVEQVAERYGADSAEGRVMKVVALCVDVPALPLNAGNIAVLLHNDVGAESLREEVNAALARLVADDRLRETEGGYKLQSPEQKSWDQARRAIDLHQGQSVRHRRLLLKQALAGLSVTRGRTFKVEVVVEGESMVPGDLPLHIIEEADQGRREQLRASSREQANESRVTWTYALSTDTWEALHELHQSSEMIERRDNANKSIEEVPLLGEERERLRRHEKTALQRLTRDLAAGQVVFRGQLDDVEWTTDLRKTAERLVGDRIATIYPRLGQFTANLRREDVLHVLRGDLRTLPSDLRDDGIGLVRVTPTGYELATDGGPLDALIAEVRIRASQGHEATGGHLREHFEAPPYGASVEVVQALCAAGIRAGLVEAIHQGQPIRNPGDQRLDQVFGALPRFVAAGFRLPADADVPLPKRVDLAGKLEHRGRPPSGYSTEVLAAAVREAFLGGREATIRVESALGGAGIPISEAVGRTRGILDRLAGDDDVHVVTTAADTWADLVAGTTVVDQLDELLATRLDDLRAAQREARRSADGLPDDLAGEHSELRDLLAAGDLAGHAARIFAVTRRLSEARAAATADAASRLRSALGEHEARLRDQFSDAGDGALAEMLRPLEALRPPDDLAGIDAEALEGRIDSAAARFATAVQQLEQLRSAGRLAWVRVGELVTDAITDETEIEPVLYRIRDAIAAKLSDGKHVRLQ
jgi:hypothetical protein